MVDYKFPALLYKQLTHSFILIKKNEAKAAQIGNKLNQIACNFFFLLSIEKGRLHREEWYSGFSVELARIYFHV